MNLRVPLQILLLCLCLSAVFGRRGNRQQNRAERRRARGRWREPVGDRIFWTRVLSSNVTVNESAILSTEHDFITVKSLDNSSRSLGYQTAVTYYGFSGQEPIMAIATAGRRGGRPCFLATPPMSYDQLVQDVLGRNGTRQTLNGTSQLNGMGEPLPIAEARAIVRENPMIRRVCRRMKFYDTRTAGAVNATAPSRVLKVLTVSEHVHITFPPMAPRARPGRRGNRGRQRGGRRGHRGGRGGRNRARGGRGGRAGRRNRRVQQQ